jgi:hypothetical protein
VKNAFGNSVKLYDRTLVRVDLLLFPEETSQSLGRSFKFLFSVLHCSVTRINLWSLTFYRAKVFYG